MLARLVSIASEPITSYQRTIDRGAPWLFRIRFQVNINRPLRSDEFVGYNDYTKSKIRLKSTFDLTDRLHASIRVTYRDQQYSNAFAFDVPGQPSKEYQEIEVMAAAEYQFTDHFSLRADVGQEVVESSDPRGEYDRTRAAIGVKWGF